ncbi:MAG: hypothetical protein HYT63_00790 [Candidatus Yanofskybacteria bacterium]|nr:hypothetical protein [Candidatus Yanofskybacteria bacterium]
MSNKNFLILVLIIFLVKVVFLPAGKIWLTLDLFVCLVLTASLVDKNFSEKFFLILAFSLVFDIFSGSTFGSVSLALLFSLLIIFWIKKFVLLSDKSFFVNFVWILLFYSLYLFLLAGLESFLYLRSQAGFSFKDVVKTNFTLSNLIQVFSFFIILAFLFKHYVAEKKVPNFKF